MSWPVAAALLILLVPVALAGAAPSLTTLPPTRSTAALPALPEPRPGALPTLDGLVDPLPIVVRDLPDGPSREAVAAYDAALLLEPTGVLTAFGLAWNGLAALSADPAPLRALAGLLSLLGADGNAPDLASPEFAGAAAAAFAALPADPRTADRLSNAAVALFAVGVGNTSGLVVADWGGYLLQEPFRLQFAAIRLLEETVRAFPDNRAGLLNLGFYRGLLPDPDTSLPLAVTPVEHRLRLAPDDRTSRFLLASLQARQGSQPDALERALATLRPLTDEAATAPLGHVGVGDAYLQTVAFRQARAPFLAAHLASQGLAAYDRALGTTTDPGVLAGRAEALALLGDDGVVESRAALRRAVALAPGSIELRLALAEAEERAGDAAGTYEAAGRALDLAGGGWNPRLADARFVAGSGFAGAEDRGYRGTSVGRDRDRAVVVWQRSAAAGGYVVALDLIPRVLDTTTDQERRTGFVLDEAARTALTAAVALGDPARAEAVAQRWDGAVAASPRLAGGYYRAATLDGKRQDHAAAVAAARLVAGETGPALADATALLRRAEAALRRLGRFGAAHAVCERAAATPAVGFDPVAAYRCAGETAYLDGDRAAAAAALGRALELAEEKEGDSPPGSRAWSQARELRPLAAVAAQAAGDEATARRLFVRAAADAATKTVAFAKLGEMALAAGDAAGALDAYDFALAAAEVDAADVAAGVLPPETADALAVATARANNNRGIARLRLAQTEPDEPPACAGERRQTCRDAAADFAAALAVDPRDPVALLNAGWAARLLDEPGQARTFLATAVEADPSLFPALNDLGVLAAEEGDAATAGDAFRRALAAQPGYDLAAWNLGVLELRRGLAGLPPGQGWLLRAIARNPSFRGHDLAFKTDERVYQVTFGPDARLGHGWSFGRASSLAAAALGAVSFAVAVGAALNSVVMGQVSDRLTAFGKDRLARGGDAVATVAAVRFDRRRFAGRRWRRWAPWLVTLPVLALVAAYPAWRADPTIGLAAAATALVAAALAVAVHEVGHALMAAWAGARLEPAQWGPGVALAVLLLPLRLSSGPFVGQRVLGIDPGRAWWVYLGGPAGNLLLAAVAYGAFLAQPLPLLRLVTEVQLAAVGYALLPFDPLDGSQLGRRPGVVAALGLFTAVAGVLFALGMI